MQLKSAIFVLAGIMFLFGNTLSAQRVKTCYDRNANFAQHKTYSWQLVKVEDPLDIDRIMGSVDAVLGEKGWVRVESGGDVSIIAVEVTRTQQMHVSYDGITGGSGWTPGPGAVGDPRTYTATYRVRTLIVDLFDTGTMQLLWRGSASKTLSNNSDENVRYLDRGVKKMFGHFPPGSPRKTTQSMGLRADLLAVRN